MADNGLLLVFINKVLFKQSHILIYLMSMIDFISQKKTRNCDKKTVKPKVFTVWLFIENIKTSK